MNIFIGCSSSDDIDEKYTKASKRLIDKIASINNLNLVFGAYYKGIMKICYDSFKSEGKQVIGVTPKIYEEALKDMNCNKEIITNTTMERFNKIYKLSNIFLILPGGIGTLAELFNAIEENRTNNANKKLIIIYNKDFFYTDIIKGLYKMYKEKFITESLAEYLIIESDENSLIKLIENNMKKDKGD